LKIFVFIRVERVAKFKNIDSLTAFLCKAKSEFETYFSASQKFIWKYLINIRYIIVSDKVSALSAFLTKINSDSTIPQKLLPRRMEKANQ
jgi:hypothetical protein